MVRDLGDRCKERPAHDNGGNRQDLTGLIGPRSRSMLIPDGKMGLADEEGQKTNQQNSRFRKTYLLFGNHSNKPQNGLV